MEKKLSINVQNNQDQKNHQKNQRQAEIKKQLKFDQLLIV